MLSPIIPPTRPVRLSFKITIAITRPFREISDSQLFPKPIQPSNFLHRKFKISNRRIKIRRSEPILSARDHFDLKRPIFGIAEPGRSLRVHVHPLCRDLFIAENVVRNGNEAFIRDQTTDPAPVQLSRFFPLGGIEEGIPFKKKRLKITTDITIRIDLLLPAHQAPTCLPLRSSRLVVYSESETLWSLPLVLIIAPIDLGAQLNLGHLPQSSAHFASRLDVLLLVQTCRR